MKQPPKHEPKQNVNEIPVIAAALICTRANANLYSRLT